MNKKNKLPFNKGHTFIKLSISQYKQFNEYLNIHKKCMMEQNRYDHSSAINGGYSLIFKIKTLNDKTNVDIFYKCNYCGDEIKLNKPKVLKNSDIEALKIKYNAFINYELVFSENEATKFDLIFEKYDGNVDVVFTPNGLNNIIEINGNNISDNSSW